MADHSDIVRTLRDLFEDQRSSRKALILYSADAPELDVERQPMNAADQGEFWILKVPRKQGEYLEIVIGRELRNELLKVLQNDPEGEKRLNELWLERQSRWRV
jgi:hypothetical protein